MIRNIDMRGPRRYDVRLSVEFIGFYIDIAPRHIDVRQRQCRQRIFLNDGLIAR